MKRLVICCDGTWNYADQSRGEHATPTNVTQVFRAVDDQDAAGVEQVPYYQPGVGTERFQRLIGGAGGYGLSRHVRDTYAFVVDEFSPGTGPEDPPDELFFFGFSRGAYTARSAVGLIRRCGILRPEHRHRVKEAYGLYRCATDEAGQEAARVFREKYSRETPVTFLGVWDTVGSLGIPLSGTRFLNVVNRRYRFHNVELSSMVQAAYQALAIDERRGPFEPAIWTQSAAARESGQVLSQVWFAGVHSDVGGGYPDDRLSSLAQRWMVANAARHGLALSNLPDVDPDYDTAIRGTLHTSRTGFYKIIKPHHRQLGMTDPEHEAAASTAVMRLRAEPAAGVKPYRAGNLTQYLSSPQHAVSDV